MRCLLFAHFLVVSSAAAQAPTSLLREFHAHKGMLREVHVADVESSATTRTQDFSLINDRGDTVRGSLRLPRTEGGRFPVAFLVVGIETGKEVVTMIEGYDSVIVVGVDYPFEGSVNGAGPYDFAGWNAVKTVFALRETGFKTVPQLLLCLDWLFSHPRVDTTDVSVVAVSFGVFTAILAAVIEKRVARLVVVQAGGNLSHVIAANSRRLEVPVPAWLAGWLGASILAPFEPNRYIGAIAPRPVLIVSGKSDTFFPQASVESLFHHAGEPREWIRHPSEHVMPGERELILELTDIVAQRLYGPR